MRPTHSELKTALHWAEAQGKTEDFSRFSGYAGEFVDCKFDAARNLTGYMLIGTSDGDIFVRLPSFHGIPVWAVAAIGEQP